MGKKKREHIVFDQMLKEKKTIPIAQINRYTTKKPKSVISKVETVIEK